MMTIDDIMPLLQSEDIEDNILGVILAAKGELWTYPKVTPVDITAYPLVTIHHYSSHHSGNTNLYKGDIIVDGKWYILRSNRLMVCTRAPDVAGIKMLYDDGSITKTESTWKRMK